MSESHDLSVYIGRFQPFHNGHLELLREGLACASRCVVVLGSSYQARTPRNPFTWEERAAMIRQALDPDERQRVVFLPIRDYYNEVRWVRAVRAGVAAAAGDGATVALIGHFKDATSEYLRNFPGWTLVPQERRSPVDAAHVRDALFKGVDDIDAALNAVAPHLPAGVSGYLRAWTALPFLVPLVEEWRVLRAYQRAWSAAPYAPVLVTVDALLKCRGHVLLVRRKDAPGKGLYAVPGGFIEQRETVYQSALRELREETSVGLLELNLRHALKAVNVFDHPDRSQRGRTITHAHFFDLGDIDLPEVHAGDDAAEALWVPIDQLVGMEDRFLDDHFHMLDHFLGLTPPDPAT